MLDLDSMIFPLAASIKFTVERNLNAIRNLSLSVSASVDKYAIAYKDFDVSAGCSDAEPIGIRLKLLKDSDLWSV